MWVALRCCCSITRRLSLFFIVYANSTSSFTAQASTPSPSPSSRCTYGWIRSQAGTLFWGRTIKKRGNFIVPPAQVPTPKKLNLFLGVVQKSNSSFLLIYKHRNRSHPPPRLNILLFMLNYCYYQYYPSICTQYKLNMNFHSSVPPPMLFTYLPVWLASYTAWLLLTNIIATIDNDESTHKSSQISRGVLKYTNSSN